MPTLPHLLLLLTLLITLKGQQINTIIRYFGDSCPDDYELFIGEQNISQDDFPDIQDVSQNGVVECIKVNNTLDDRVKELESENQLFADILGITEQGGPSQAFEGTPALKQYIEDQVKEQSESQNAVLLQKIQDLEQTVNQLTQSQSQSQSHTNINQKIQTYASENIIPTIQQQQSKIQALENSNFQSQIQTLETEISQSTSDIQQLKTSVDSLTQQYNQISNDIHTINATLSDQLNNHSSQLDRVNQTLSTVQTQIESLKQFDSSSVSNDQIEIFGIQLQNINQTVNDVEQLLTDQLQNQSQKIEDFLLTQQSQQLDITQLKTSNIQSSNRINSFTNQMTNEISAQIQSFNNDFQSKLSTQVNDLKEQIPSLIQDYLSDNQTLYNQEIQYKIETLQNSTSVLSNITEFLGAELQSVNQSFKQTLNGTVEQFTNQLQNQSSIIEEIRSTQNSQQESITELNTLGNQSSNRIDSFSDQITNEISTQIQSFRIDFQQMLSTEVDHFDDQISESNDNISRLNVRVNGIQDKQQTLGNQQQIVTNQITNVNTIIYGNNNDSSTQTPSRLDTIAEELSGIQGQFKTQNEKYQQDQTLTVIALIIAGIDGFLTVGLGIYACVDRRTRKRLREAGNPRAGDSRASLQN